MEFGEVLGMNFTKLFKKSVQFQFKKKITFAVCFEITKQTAKHPLQFASKLQSKLQRVLRSLFRNFKANCKGTLHFDLKLYCLRKNFVRFMPNTFQNDIQKTSE